MFTLSTHLYASHTAGGELIYKKVPGTVNSYIFYFKFYRNCANNGSSAATEPPTFTMCYTSPCTGTIQQIVMPKMVGVIPTTPPVQNGSTLSNGCDSTITQCELLSSPIPGYEQWWYSATISLPVLCNDWRFWVDLCCRNNNILNIGNTLSSGYNLYVETHFDNLNAALAQDNSSPYFLNSNSFSSLVIPYMYVNAPYFHNGGAVDPDGDSLYFELINPRDGVPCATTLPLSILSAGYNLNSVAGQPMDCNNTFYLDPNTGNFTLTPNVIGKFVLSIKCSEYRNGILLGSIMRDMQVVVDNYTQMPVTTVIDPNSITNGTVVSDTVKTCPGNNLSFCFDIISTVSGVNVKHMIDNAASAFPGSTITFSNPYDSILNVCMTWQPTVSDIGWHTLFVQVKDTLNCLSTPAIQNITLFVNKPIKASNDTTICAGQTIKLWANGNSGFSWNVLPGGSNMSTLNCLTGNCDTVNVNPIVTTSYVVTDTVCGYQDTITVGIIQSTTVAIITNINTCNSYTFNNQTITQSGTYYDTLLNSTGCDSIIMLNLTINNANTATTQSGTQLTATATGGASYQWLTCNPFIIILGDTNQTYTATANGDYAVAVTENGCTDTSNCMTVNSVGINELNAQNLITISPNPTSSIFKIECPMNGANVILYNLFGQKLLTSKIENQTSLIDISHFTKGIYFAEIIDDKTSYRVKIIKD
jgi:hypothetical protein